MCGLKHDNDGNSLLDIVTPCVGVWIETIRIERYGSPYFVTPCVGVWIETGQLANGNIKWGHTLRGCVDWNVAVDNGLETTSCHTLRGCVDWNWYQIAWRATYKQSHPAWVCGLKPKWKTGTETKYSHTLRGCVDWNLYFDSIEA